MAFQNKLATSDEVWEELRKIIGCEERELTAVTIRLESYRGVITIDGKQRELDVKETQKVWSFLHTKYVIHPSEVVYFLALNLAAGGIAQVQVCHHLVEKPPEKCKSFPW